MFQSINKSLIKCTSLDGKVVYGPISLAINSNKISSLSEELNNEDKMIEISIPFKEESILDFMMFTCYTNSITYFELLNKMDKMIALDTLYNVSNIASYLEYKADIDYWFRGIVRYIQDKLLFPIEMYFDENSEIGNNEHFEWIANSIERIKVVEANKDTKLYKKISTARDEFIVSITDLNKIRDQIITLLNNNSIDSTLKEVFISELKLYSEINGLLGNFEYRAKNTSRLKNTIRLYTILLSKFNEATVINSTEIWKLYYHFRSLIDIMI